MVNDRWKINNKSALKEARYSLAVKNQERSFSHVRNTKMKTVDFAIGLNLSYDSREF